MEVDASQEIEAVELSESQTDDDRENRPIMLLLKRLIRNKQNTVMTNTQIIEILKQEFDINVQTCHEMEVDIYIKIIKKYLKDWPQWEELERISSKLSSAKDYDAVTKVLNHKYKNLKEYLNVMLEAAKPLAKKAVLDLEATKEDAIEDNSEVVIEVYCTRDQLTHLVYEKPRLLFNSAIFNIAKIEPTRISLNTLSFESILNFWWTKVNINLPFFIFIRELQYKYKHTLVNKAREEKTVIETLDTRFYNKAKKSREFSKAGVLKYFEKILDLTKDKHVRQFLEVLFQIFVKDLQDAPNVLKVPSSYRRNANKYKYVRYLSVDNDDNPESKHDLCLEEFVTPSYCFFIGRLGGYPEKPIMYCVDWLKIECLLCKTRFHGSTDGNVLQAHFNVHHQQEPDWQCAYCKRLFSMDFLSKNKWNHEC